ncbi:MAG: glycosyltransferase [Candidatus Rokuibacteriota bacterium]
MLRRWLIGVMLLSPAALPLVHSSIVLPLTPGEQAQVALVMLGAGLLASRSRSLRPMIIFLSCFASMRYFYWRVTWTLNLESFLDVSVSLVLLAAEIYGLVILFLGYFQTLEIEQRRIPPRRSEPSVDVLIPTFNEPESIVRRTVIGALAMSYPRRRVYVLDDARRPEIEAMAGDLDCGYLAREDNRHAKAGNLNHAFGLTSGELIAVFDADHVPVRGFLDKTVGFFEDPRIALVQTAQHFFTPDPFERNLRLADRIPPEQSFFYHVIQPGNDFWNSAFFCGSCAVLRRSALDRIGGFQTGSVTEDVHTSLALHAAGYRSVYLPVPMAAGLATETLAAHVKQRTRWARGMAQVLRLDCPLLKRGLSLPQRVNYFNAMLHFFFGIPRLVMIAAPLTFLLFGLHPIKADALAVVAYILPHIGLSTIANSMSGRQHRHSFWASVYEVSIAPFTARVTLLALLNPRLGKFEVTDKGTTVDHARFDLETSRLTLVLLALSAAALVVAFPVRLFLFATSPGDPSVLDAIVMNSLWAFGNMVTLVAAACVAYEQPQQRTTPRVKRRFACEVIANGVSLPGHTSDLSEHGVRVVLAEPGPVPSHCRIVIAGESDRRWEAPATRTRCDWNAAGAVEAAFVFDDLDGATDRALVEIMFSDDRSWSADHYPPDRLTRSSWRLLTTIWRVLRPRVPSRRHSPRLEGPWRAWYRGRECTCLSLSGVGALIEPHPDAGDPADAGPLRIEIEPGRVVEAPSALPWRVSVEPRWLVLRFDWPDFGPMRDFWANAHVHGPAGPIRWRKGRPRRSLEIARR